MLVFAEGGKPEDPEKNPLSRVENQHKINALMASGPGIEPGPYWWEVRAFTTTPTLLRFLFPTAFHVDEMISIACTIFK